MSLIPQISGRRIGIAGLGARTGVSLVRFLSQRGAQVKAYDQRPKSELKDRIQKLSGFPFHLETETENPKEFLDTDLIITSPGVPITSNVLKRVQSHGVPIWSEIEFSSRFLSCPILAVTGTNGKSTTVALLAHLLEKWGKKVFAGGNLGNPLIEAVDKDFDFAVVEVSSFQLEAVESFCPKLGVLLNISPNHLDRHGDLANYVACKERLFAQMTQEHIALLNQEDPICLNLAKQVSAQVLTFSRFVHSQADFRLEGDKKRVLLPNEKSLSLKEFRLLGLHNQENALAALAAGFVMGCPSQTMEDGISSFQGLPHRLKLVATSDGVQYFNDSKSTTPASTVRALESFEKPLILLAGGQSKGVDYDEVARVAKQKKVRHSIFFGEASTVLTSAFKKIPHKKVRDLEQAVFLAKGLAEPGDVVLFSPASASFDQYRNYEERGTHFVELVKKYLDLKSCTP